MIRWLLVCWAQVCWLLVGLLAVGNVMAQEPTGIPPIQVKPPIRIRPFTSGSPGYNPSQIRHAYGFDSLNTTGSGQTIGVVDAFDDPTITSDLQTFIAKFHLAPIHGLTSSDPCNVTAGPHPCFQKTWPGRSKPKLDTGWAGETALDVEWAHAIAPGSDMLLVEGQSDSFSHLFSAVSTAAEQAPIVSMSWGAPEFNLETKYDRYFNQASTTFVASSGDSGTGVSYPAASPYVLAVGGTTLHLDKTGRLTKPETAWNGSGGGISSYENEPDYQVNRGIASSGKRATPDVAYNADPNTGFAVYSATGDPGQTGWMTVGGTSAGAPQWAALLALAKQGGVTPSLVYQAALGTNYKNFFTDITSGNNGSCGQVCKAATNFDFVTGLGTPLATKLVPWLMNQTLK